MARSLKKGPFVDPSLQKKVEKMAQGGREAGHPDLVAALDDHAGHGRASRFHVHNGKLFMPVFVTENMVGPSPRRVRADAQVHRSLDGQEGEGPGWKSSAELSGRVGCSAAQGAARRGSDPRQGRRGRAEAPRPLAEARRALRSQKLLRSAVANAEQKNERDKAGIDVDNLVVHTVFVDEGPSQWRIRPRAQGRATWIQKRSHHVTVVLAER